MTGLNRRSSTARKPVSSTFTTTRIPSSSPNAHATHRRGRAGSTRASATSTMPSRGSRRKAPGVISCRRSGSTRDSQTSATARAVTGAPARTRRAAGTARGVASVAPLPQHVPAERLHQQHERDRPAAILDAGAGSRSAATTASTTPCTRRDDLGPVARWRGSAQPREGPAGGDVHVSHRPDGEHPHADVRGDVHAQHGDEEGVDLHVEPGTERRHGAGAPGDPSVDGVEQQGDRGQADQDRDRGPADEGVRGQRRDRARHLRADQGHAAGRPDPRGARAGPAPPRASRRAPRR